MSVQLAARRRQVAPPTFSDGLGKAQLGKAQFGKAQLGLIFVGVCRVIFDDIIKNGEFQRVGTTPPIEKALVN